MLKKIKEWLKCISINYLIAIISGEFVFMLLKF